MSSWGPSGACLQFFCISATRQVQTISSLSESSTGSSTSGREILNWGLHQNVSVEDAGQTGCAGLGLLSPTGPFLGALRFQPCLPGFLRAVAFDGTLPSATLTL